MSFSLNWSFRFLLVPVPGLLIAYILTFYGFCVAYPNWFWSWDVTC